MAIELWLDTSKYKIRSLPCITSVNPSFNLSPLSKREHYLELKPHFNFASGVTHNEMISLWCKATKETMIDQWL
ncbi:unnamed protein product [Lactuca saligna]|uniref:Uncharacterized protein n=1 Tax=Lactuca saligna TaxID=75948 RepID=A0AA35YK71_LACSI|nr:unnamed protein product [Lactuca saligna]